MRRRRLLAALGRVGLGLVHLGVVSMGGVGLLACADAGDPHPRTLAPASPAGSSSAVAQAADAAPPAPPTCAAGELALDGACAPLGPDTPADALLGFGRLGLWNTWSTVSPLTRGSVEKLTGAVTDLEPIGGAPAARATCDRDGWVEGRSRDRGASRFAVHLAWIVASRETEADLWASVVGALEVRLGDAPPIHVAEVRGGEGRALLDETRTRLRIPRGATAVAVIHERPEGKSGGFFLRVRDPRGGFPSGVRVAPRVATARCAPSALLDAHPRLTPVVEGGAPAFALEVAPAFEGLAPLDASLQLTAVLRRGREMSPASSTEPLAADGLRTGQARARLVVPAPARGEAVVALQVTGEQTATPGGGEAGAGLVAELAVRAHPGDLHARVARLAAASPRTDDPRTDDPRTDDPRTDEPAAPLGAARASLAHHVEVLARAVAGGEKDHGWLEAHTRRAEDVAAAIARAEDPYPAARGAVFRAYRSPLDGRLQPYVVHVPPSADRGAPLPVVVVAHGMDRLPEHALRTLVGQAPDDTMSLDFAAKHLPRLPDLRAILVAPWQFGNAGPHPLGEADLAAVLDDVAATWKVDPERVSITGYSLGGTVAFVAPVRAPGRFAASAPLCGYPNLMDYKSVRNVPKAPWEPALLAREYVVGMLENAASTAFHVVHGGKDVPGRSKVVVDRLRKLDQPVTWNLIEDADHDVWTEGYEDGKMIGWLTRHRRPSAPRRVRLITGEYRVDRAAWLRVVALEDAGAEALATIDARFDPARSTLDVTSRGVAAFTVDRAGLPDARGTAHDPGEVHLVVDGRDLGAVPAGAPLVVVRDAAGAPQLASEVPTRAGMKRHGVSGPLEDALFHPLLIVRGTADPALTEANRLVAEHLQTAWGTATVRYPVVTDGEVDDARLRGRSVVLVGGPPSNLLARRWESALPARFLPGAIEIRGKRHEGGDVAVSLIAPRPGDPDQVVVLHGALSEEGTLAIRNLPRYLPDWVVYDARIARERGGLLFGDRPTRDGGFFDASWK